MGKKPTDIPDDWEEITKGLYEEDNYRRMPEVYDFIISTVNTFAVDRHIKILDIGCGDGSLLQQMSRCGDLYGVDIAEAQIEIAKQKGVDACYCSIDRDLLPYNDKLFDVIISSEVIEHVLVPDKLLVEAHRVLKDDGIFIVTTPNLAGFGKRLLLLVNKNPFIECSPLQNGAVGHLRYFIFSTLLTLVKRYEFELVKFTSDVINFDKYGLINSKVLARMFPAFGRSLIFVLRKAQGNGGS